MKFCRKIEMFAALVLFGCFLLLPTGDALRIAHIAALNIEVPINGSGGLEKVVEVLIFEQLRAGHQVTLFASDDSGQLEQDYLKEKYKLPKEKLANFKLVNSGRKSLHFHTRDYEEYIELVKKEKLDVYFADFMKKVVEHAEQFDILHFHSMDHFEFYDGIFEKYNDITITTMHMSLGSKRVADMLALHKNANLVSITNNQRSHLKANYKPNFIGTVYNGYPLELYTFKKVPEPKPFVSAKGYLFGEPGPDNGRPYLAFLGRFSCDKGVHNAIKIALHLGMELRIAAKYNAHEDAYFKSLVKMVEEAEKKDAAHKGLIKFVGEINDKQKSEFLGNAQVFLFPIEWQEPFGLVMIEAMASGTPVVGPKMASVPEVVGNTGGLTFEVPKKMVNGELRAEYTDDVIKRAAGKVKKAMKMSRQKVRDRFANNFSIATMVGGYQKIYKKIYDKTQARKNAKKQDQGKKRKLWEWNSKKEDQGQKEKLSGKSTKKQSQGTKKQSQASTSKKPSKSVS